MILSGQCIKEEVLKKHIVLKPFNEEQITTNSYDIHIGNKYLDYLDEVLDPKVAPKYKIRTIPKAGLYLKRGDFVLASSKEIVGSTHYVPIIHAKSGIARLGLFVHVTADLIDIGSIGNVTFQLFATKDIKIYPNMLLAQVSFWVPKGEIVLYSGKYQNSKGPQASKTYKDFK